MSLPAPGSPADRSLATPPANVPGVRVARQTSFTLLAARLIGAIVLEGIVTLGRFLVFPLQARAVRARIRALILGRTAAACAVLALALPACSSPHPGSSFQHQLDETAWSAREIVRMDDAQQSLEETLEDLGTGVSASELVWDLEQIFLSPDAQRSIEDDLSDLGDFEPGSIPETFELLGW